MSALRDIIVAAMAMILAAAVGGVLGWQWRGDAFELQAEAMRQKASAEKQATETAVAHARRQTSVAEKAAETADAQRADAISKAMVGAADDVEAINRHIAEVNR